MSTNALFSFFHFIAAFGVVYTVVFELLTFQKNLSLLDAKKIQKVDMIYGLSAGLVLLIGFLRVFYFEKGSDFYFSNFFFLLKIGTFLVVGGLSIYPTITFAKWQKFTNKGEVPIISDSQFKWIKLLLKLELIGLIVIMLAASMMAKGIGF
ncbi:MAG: DUF2214 family protein [Reichenbachiella sp.]